MDRWWWCFGLLTVILLPKYTLVCGQDGKCLSNTVSSPKRYFNFKSSNQVLVIESSERITHNLTSNIFSIFLQEVLGYDRVSIVIEDGFDYDEAVRRMESNVENSYQLPSSLLNMELWVPINFTVVRDSRVSEAGLIAPLGRFGWFVRNRNALTWTTLTTLKGSSEIALPENITQYLISHAVNYCTTDGCDKRTYTPQRCINQPCATLLADRFAYTKFVVDHIEELKLYVQVIWLGPALGKVLREIQNDKIPWLVLTWSPGEVTAFGNWHPVLFPPCQLDADNGPGCFYGWRRMVKLVSDLLRNGANPAFLGAFDIAFAKEDYEELLQSAISHPEKSHYDIACDWMKKNIDFLQSWKPLAEDLNLRILALFPIRSSLFSPMGLYHAAAMARDAINANKNILPLHHLDVINHNADCRTEKDVNPFIDYVLESKHKQLIGILGPPCSEAISPLVGLTKYFRTVVISYSAEGSTFANRKEYPYFFRTIGENQQFKYVYLMLLERLEWKRMAALSEDGQKYTEYLSHLQELVQENNLTFITHRKFPPNRVNATMRTYLEDLQKRRARIIVADVHDSAARAVMCGAYHLNMTAKEGYVWFLPHWLSTNWYNTTIYSNKNNSEESLDCSASEMFQAINGHFSMSHQYFAPDNEVTHENITVGAWRKSYLARLNGSPESPFAGYTYDAVWTYALALHKLYTFNESYIADIHATVPSEKYVHYIERTNFTGVSGRIQFSSSASRTTNINILQWVNGTFNVIGTAYPRVAGALKKVEDYKLDLNVSKIIWMTDDRQRPGDGEEESSCMLQGLADSLNLNCSGAIVVANVIGFGILAIILAAAVLFTKYRFDKSLEKLQSADQYIKCVGIDLLPNVSELQRWEIKRDHVVINRKLGIGNFGTVYGGEAFFPDQGWVAVAVKTLKVDAGTEYKLDFVGEAEIMKRFDHKNIIKLLGVCTTSEPMYTVMEFMLHGDVRTYLQNRRHLVNGRRLGDESNDVSNKRLTAIALDIARGLTYLHSLKYVHRDLASRNCLISSQRVTKISDFGMTRRTYDSDHYKFSRKGMMPIRWMAPESLRDGVFTAKSDIWAFGVVLYEIITFGVTPFGNHVENTEVVEKVKSGKTLPVPKQAKPQLEALMKSCWNQDFNLRPEAHEVYVFLGNNQRLLSPCLEDPSTYDAPLLSLEGQFPPLDLPDKIFLGTHSDEQNTEDSELHDCQIGDNPREALLPNNKPVSIAMTEVGFRASRNSDGDLEVSSGVL